MRKPSRSIFENLVANCGVIPSKLGDHLVISKGWCGDVDPLEVRRHERVGGHDPRRRQVAIHQVEQLGIGVGR